MEVLGAIGENKRATFATQLSPPPAPGWMPGRVARLLLRDGTLSIDGLDIAVRGFGVAIVVLWSLLGYTRGLVAYSWEMTDPALIALGLILYNVLVIAVVGIPWRISPGFPHFVLDWVVASLAILLTGGFISPFILLYYALIIGASLRVQLSRSIMLAAACAVMFVALTLLHPEQQQSIQLPILVVQIASIAMVMFMSAGMKRAVEVEARRAELEERATKQLRLLNNLTNTVLAGPPDLSEILRTVASASKEALKADSGLAVLAQPTSTSKRTRLSQTAHTQSSQTEIRIRRHCHRVNA